MHEPTAEAKELFLQALDLPEAERAAFLAEACADEALRLQVQELLGAMARASGFLGDGPPTEEGPGTVLEGRYVLETPLGEGGFGVVWRAEQREPVRRAVAVKIVKRGMDTQRVVQRFAQEQQALARMQHPHIAAVFDGGTTPSGRPFFVMELVEGVPITRFCRDHQLGLDDRIELLRQVCLAVQHAHHKGVVHRDLKPGNVLCAAAADGAPQPKVIDFGIAKALDPDLDASATLTLQGQPLGTLEYMAPEQAAGTGDIDARADVYSLGVLLHELLCGRRPFERSDVPDGGAAAVLERIRDTAPARPSQRLTDAAGAQLGLSAAALAHWQRRLRSDLDWVVLRALAKDPARRYPTPASLADDLQRNLAGLPLAAGPPTAAYQLRCFIGRHRLAVLTAAVLFAALCTGVVTTATALGEARREAAQKQRALAAVQDLLLAADPARQKGQGFTVRQLLDEFAAGLGERFDREPELARELHLTVGGAYRNLGRLAEAERHLRQAVAFAEAGGVAAAATSARSRLELAHVLRELGQFDAALQQLAAAEALPPAGATAGWLAARLQLERAELLRRRGDLVAAATIAEAVLAAQPEPPADAAAAADRAMALDLRAAAAAARGDFPAAQRDHEAALALRQGAFGPDHLLVAVSWANLAETNRARGDLDAATAAADQALRLQLLAAGEGHLAVARTIALQGHLARQRNEPAAAESHYRHAQRIREQVLPADHFLLAQGDIDLGHLALDRGDAAAAVALWQGALTRRRSSGAPEDGTHAALLQNLGVALAAQQQHEDAAAHYAAALALHRQLGGDTQPAVADCLQNLALVRERLGAPEDAKALFAEAVRLRRAHHPADREALRQALRGLAQAARAAGDRRGAAAAELDFAALVAADAGAEAGGPTAERAIAARSRAARLLLDAGDATAAATELDAVIRWCEQYRPEQWPLGQALSLRAECHLVAGEAQSALPLAQRGLALLEPAGIAAELVERARATAAAAASAVAALPAEGRR